MCKYSDNSCRQEKLTCKGCYYDNYCNELISKVFDYKFSISDVRKISEIIKKIFFKKISLSNFRCKS